jgi:predicted transcriptional regulator of viral defense system
MNTKLKHSQVGVQLVRRLAAEGDRIFSMDRARQLSREVGLKPAYLAQALYHLRQDGWIAPVRRGLYAIASSVPGIPPTHEFELAMALVNPAAISHWSAMQHHGLTQQIPRQIFVLTTTGNTIPRARGLTDKQSGYRLGETIFQFVQIKPDRFFGIENVWISESRISMTDPERTLLDGLMMPQYCGGFGEVLHAFQTTYAKLNRDRIIDYALRLDGATAKRLGWVLEQQGEKAQTLEPLSKLAVTGYRKLDATGPRTGAYNRRWMIQENFPGTQS